ncbi:MAG TPA: RNA polymerase subunit sigma-24 [Deltaproteobacteria bacterium]|nr:RNA polymerase subunit sigma-24 [Deltaproteobacteria bacterium]
MDRDVTQQAEFVGQITRHQTALRAYIISLMPGMDGVSDVLQETNVVLWEKRGKFQPGTNFRAWACAIARYEVKTHRRKMLRLGMTLLDEDLAEQLADRGEETPEKLDERLRALDKCLTRLEDNSRQLVEHRYHSEASLEEFATRSGRSAESLRVMLFRIRAALKKCINNELAINSTRS